MVDAPASSSQGTSPTAGPTVSEDHVPSPPKIDSPPLATSKLDFDSQFPPPDVPPSITQSQPSPADNETAVRPSFPGVKLRTRSKLDAEPNPFEQSFSTNRSSFGASSVGSKRSPAPDFGSDRPSPFNPDLSNASSSISRPVLPGVSQITTPLGEDDPFRWPLNTPAISSIRGDPLSPSNASKSHTTPAASVLVSHALNFDPNNFVRTGLTPGTGMTPMDGGPTSFPPPSPGTAAFLAMVTNATAGATNTMGGPLSNEEMMTPGTFNGMLNRLSNMSNQQQHLGGSSYGSSRGANTNESGPPTHPAHPLAISSTSPSNDYFSHRPSPASTTHVQQSIQQDQEAAAAAAGSAPMSSNGNSSLPNSTGPVHAHLPNQPRYGPSQPNGNPDGPASYMSAHPMGHPNVNMLAPEHYIQQGQVAASQAANGLFLLSQAHHAIAKKEQNDQIYGPGSVYPVPPMGGQYGSPHQSALPAPSVPSPVKGKGKRKQTNESTPVSKKAATAGRNRGKKAMSEESDEFGMMDESTSPVSSSNGMGKNGKPETEEEKRKNFLERNRQAALKCRQRKKAWLGQLQTKVESLQTENDQLNSTVSSLREEITRLQATLSKAGLLPSTMPVLGGPSISTHPPLPIQQQHHPHLAGVPPPHAGFTSQAPSRTNGLPPASGSALARPPSASVARQAQEALGGQQMYQPTATAGRAF